MQFFRIASFDHKIFSRLGAAIVGGRWNSIGSQVIYAATSLAGAKLELLAHTGFRCIPKNYGYVEIRVPSGVTKIDYPRPTPPKETSSQAWGDKWVIEKRSAVALVPSASSPSDFNALINPAHPDFDQIVVSAEYPVLWDRRHFAPKTQN